MQLTHTVDEALSQYELIAAAGSEEEGQACAMTLLAWLAGEQWTDHPVCAHRLICDVVIRGNDAADTTPEERADLVRLGQYGALDTWWIPTEVVVSAITGHVDRRPYQIAAEMLEWVTGWKASKTHPNLFGADLTMADLTGADLTGADLTGADLTGADLIRADLTRADLTRANLTGAYLTGANLRGANLTGANLRGANLTEAYLTGAYLTEAYLTEANLTRANLTRADLFGADLTMADLTGADLTGADLTGADLTGADLTGADLIRADLRGAKSDTSTIWPAAFTVPESVEKVSQ